jgi:hypothetical protein
VHPLDARPSAAPAGAPADGADPIRDGRPPYRAAWVPADDPRRAWDPTPDAVRWILQQADLLQLKPVLLSDPRLTGALTPALSYLDLRARHDRWSRVTGRAVLVMLPTLGMAARALRAAHGGAVAIIEAAEVPLAGWAAETRALNLVTGRPQEALARETLRDLGRLRRCGDGEWLTPAQADAARAVLQGMATPADPGQLAGYLLAHGRSTRSIRQLLKPAGRSPTPDGACRAAGTTPPD